MILYKSYINVSEFGNYKIQECKEDGSFVLWDKEKRALYPSNNNPQTYKSEAEASNAAIILEENKLEEITL